MVILWQANFDTREVLHETIFNSLSMPRANSDVMEENYKLHNVCR